MLNKLLRMRTHFCFLAIFFAAFSSAAADDCVDPDSLTLTSDAPLTLYDTDPNHLWNRLYSALYIRPRHLPAAGEQPATIRYEGGDVIEFLAWGRTEYWSTEAMFAKLAPLLDEFIDSSHDSERSPQMNDPLRRIVLQHDLWAAFDHLIDLNNRRVGDLVTRQRRDELCRKLAKCIQSLAIPASELEQLPDTYTLAVRSGDFVPHHDNNASADYLPHGLLSRPDEWVEIDVYFPDMHEDIMDRFISLHARSFMGRSHYRIFYRFPEGRQQVVTYLEKLEHSDIDWKHAAQFGFLQLRNNGPQIPVGTEVLLMQQMVVLNDEMKPVPTNIVESVQFRAYLNIHGAATPATNTGVGMNVLDYRMKRGLLFDGLKSGGLAREPEAEPQYRVAIDGSKPTAPDWGFADKTVLFQQCADCHMSPKLDRLGAASIPSLTHAGFDAGAQMGISRPLNPNQTGRRGERVARYKSRHESYRRLLEYLGM